MYGSQCVRIHADYHPASDDELSQSIMDLAKGVVHLYKILCIARTNVSLFPCCISSVLTRAKCEYVWSVTSNIQCYYVAAVNSINRVNEC